MQDCKCANFPDDSGKQSWCLLSIVSEEHEVEFGISGTIIRQTGWRALSLKEKNNRQDKDAQEVVDIINRFYQEDKKHKVGVR